MGVSANESDLAYFVSLLFHVSLSLLFAFIAAVLVKFYAPYACGSGVPEVNFVVIQLRF